MRLRGFYTVVLIALLVPLAATAEPVRNDSLLRSPWPHPHRTAGRQASTPLAGPTDASQTETQLRVFERDIGTDFGASPFIVLSEKKYRDRPQARTVWGATLSHAYKYVIDGDEFRYVDSFPLAGFPSISWNLFGLRNSQGGHIVVPQPFGLRKPRYRNTACFGRKPALIVLQDGPTTESKIECVKKFELDNRQLRAMCRPPAGWKLSLNTGVLNSIAATGEIVTVAEYQRRGLRRDKRFYAVIIDNELSRLKACGFIDDFSINNQIPSEPLGNGVTALYFPTDDGIVKMLYNASQNTLSREWKYEAGFRARTGTTPTLVGYGEDKFVVVVEGKCAVSNVFSGKIMCSDDTSPSKLIAIRRDRANPEAYVVPLPDYITTVENSPSALNHTVVVANYGGYRPNLEAKGVVAIEWLPQAQQWQLLWENPSIQMNGVTTISEGSGLVYSSGIEADGNVYMYGLQLGNTAAGRPQQGGEVVFRQKVGDAAVILDQGNNTIVNDDASLIYSGNKGLVRLRAF